MIAERTDALAAFHAKTFLPAAEATPRQFHAETATTFDDAEIIRRAREAKNGAKFSRLWAGDTGEYGGDDSAADLALLSLLAFWTRDRDQLDRLFRRSGLCRGKWEDRPDYRKWTLDKALDRAEVYEPPAKIVTPGRNGASGHADAGDVLSSAVAPFPLAVLPPPVRAFVVSAAAAIGCPPDFVAVPLLALAEGTMGRSRRLVIRPGYEVSPGSWYGVIAEPGTGKSPALKYAMRVITPLQDEAWEHYRSRLETWESLPKEERGEKPSPEHFYNTDTTGEALWDALASSPGVTQVEDELRRHLKALDAYRQAGDRQSWLALWSNAPVKRVRRTSAPVYLPFPVAPLVGGIQPGVLRHLRGEGDDADADDGWVPRFFLSWPDAEPLALSDTPFDAATLPPVVDVFRGLRLRRPEPHDATLSADAYAAFKLWHGDNRRAQMAARGLERQWAAKAPFHLARLALALHTLADPFTDRRPLSRETMADAITLLEYFREHLERALPAFGGGAAAGVQLRILRILRNPKAPADGGWISRTEANKRLGNVKPATLTAAFDALLAAGIVEREVRPTATKPAEWWRLAADPAHTATDDSDYSDYSTGSGSAQGGAIPNGAENLNNPNRSSGKTRAPGADRMEDDPWAGSTRVRL